MAKNPAPRKDPTPRPPSARSRPRPAAKSPDAPVSPPTDGGPTHDEIARRAYEIHRERGGAPGTDQDDWLQAERELNEARRRKPS